MADPRISEDFIIGQASLVNEIEDQRDAFNDALKSAWSDYREELKLLGLTGKEIAAEVAALKSAISDTRMTAEDRAKAEEKADGKDGYLAILSSPRARARIREAKSEPQPTKAAGQVEQRAALAISGERVAATSSVENEAAEISTPITEQQDAPHPASDLTASPKLPQGQVAPIQPETATSFADAGAHGAEADDSDSNAVALVPATQDGSANIGGQDEVHARSGSVDFPGRRQSDPAPKEAHSGSEHQRTYPSEINEAPAGRVADESPAPLSFADKIRRLRPNCQHPEACRSSGGKAHCGPCGRAAEAGSAA